MTQRLRRALEEQKRSTQQEALRFTGILGIALGGSRVVEVPTRNGYVYVRLRDNPNEVIQAFNNQVAPSYNLPVIVERQHNKYVVSGLDTERYENNWNSFSPYLPRHGNTHSFDIESGGGGDTVWVYPRQFMPALVFPSGSLGGPNVLIAPYTLKNDNGTWRYTGNTGTQSFAPYRPTSPTGAVMGLVYLDTSDGNPYFIINSGTVFSNSITGSSQIVSYIPSLPNPATQIPLSAIRLITGTSQISWDNIYDVRQWIHNVPTGTGGGSSSITVQDEGASQGSATTFNFVGDNVQATVVGSTARIFVTGSSGGGINTGTLDARYLKLDASNDPITGELTIEVTDAPDISGQALSVIANDPSVNRIAIDGESHGNYGLGLITYNFSTIDSSQSLTDGLVHTEANTVISRFSESGTSTFTGPAIQINDEANLVNHYGGTLRHFISGTVELLRLNPQATGTVIPYLFNTQYTKPTGTILQSWQVQGVEKARVDVSGTFYSNGQPLVKESPVDGLVYGRKNAGWILVSGSSGGSSATPHAPGGRLSLVSGTPVMTSEQANKTIIYYTPYTSDLYPSYNGSWTERSLSQIQLNLDSDTGHAAYHASGTVYDLFVYNDTGTDRLCSVAWANSTTKAINTVRLNGVLVNVSSTTARYGNNSGDTLTIPQNQGTYVGTFRANHNGQTTWELGGTAAGGDPGNLFLRNVYNRVRVAVQVRDNTDSWTYSNSGVWRQANGSNNNRVTAVFGTDDDMVEVSFYMQGTASASGYAAMGVGVDSTSSPTGILFRNGSTTVAPMSVASYVGNPGIGVHFFAALEFTDNGASPVTFFGDASQDFYQMGLEVRLFM